MTHDLDVSGENMNYRGSPLGVVAIFANAIIVLALIMSSQASAFTIAPQKLSFDIQSTYLVEQKNSLIQLVKGKPQQGKVRHSAKSTPLKGKSKTVKNTSQKAAGRTSGSRNRDIVPPNSRMTVSGTAAVKLNADVKASTQRLASKPLDAQTRIEALAKLRSVQRGPILPSNIVRTFFNSKYVNKKLETDTIFFKYHGTDNRTGRKVTWTTDRMYVSEKDLRRDLAIKREWGVNINRVSQIKVPKGNWISDGKAAAQGNGYPGGGYQAVIMNVPRSWILRTDKVFEK